VVIGGIVLALPLESVIPGILSVYAIGIGWMGVASVRAADKTSAQEHIFRDQQQIPTNAAK
jgi:hypothetical protein